MQMVAEKGTLRRGREMLAQNRPPGPVVLAKVRGRVSHALSRHVGSIAEQPVLSELAHNLRTVLRKKDTTDAFCDAAGMAPTSALLDGLYLSLLSSFPPGSVISQDSVVAASWRVAGNLPALAAGSTVGAWAVQEYPEWCLALVAGYNKGSMWVQVHSGRAAGLTIAIRCAQERMARVATTCGMLRDRDLDTVALNPREVVGAWLHVHMAAGIQFTVSELRCPQSLKARNKKLYLARRRPERVCPRSFPWECYACPMHVGKCSLGVHAAALEVRACASKHEGFVTRGGSLCVTCEANEWRGMRGLPLYLPPKITKKSEG